MFAKSDTHMTYWWQDSQQKTADDLTKKLMYDRIAFRSHVKKAKHSEDKKEESRVSLLTKYWTDAAHRSTCAECFV